MVRAPTIECKTSLSGASDHGKSQPQKTDHPNIQVTRDSMSGMTAPTVRAAKCSFLNLGLSGQTKAIWRGVSVMN